MQSKAQTQTLSELQARDERSRSAETVGDQQNGGMNKE